jgi:hypothetical protein
VRNGFVPQVRREVASRFKGLEIETCPFPNLPEKKRTQWGLDQRGNEKLCMAQVAGYGHSSGTRITLHTKMMFARCTRGMERIRGRGNTDFSYKNCYGMKSPLSADASPDMMTAEGMPLTITKNCLLAEDRARGLGDL